MSKYNTKRLCYHKPTTSQQVVYERINGLMRSVGTQLDMLLPDGADKTLVFRTLETLRMRANASVALADTPMFVGNDSDLEDFWG